MDFGNLDPVRSLGSKYNLASKNVISSSYWKVPDPKTNLTSVACHETDPFVAVASASPESNLFIYEVTASQNRSLGSLPNCSTTTLYDGSQDSDPEYQHINASTASQQEGAAPKPKPSHRHSTSVSSEFSQSSGSTLFSNPALQKSPVLIHHQTISLGGIHSLAWVPAKHKISDYENILATGHSGTVHLVMLPDPYENNGPAEILSRFNHTRHLSPNSITSSRIRALNIANNSWKCCPESSIISLFSEHLFLWDPSRGDVPIVKLKTRKSRSFHASPLRNGIVSLATNRGISIMDIRYKNPAPLAPPNSNDGNVSLVKWSSIDENRVASVHDQTLIKVWDIRAGSPLMTLDGHFDKVNSIDWSLTNPNEFISASSDGTVRLWNLQKCVDLEVSANSNISNYNSYTSQTVKDSADDWLPNNSWKLYRQRLARENNTPSYNYFLDNMQQPDSPCTTIFSNKKEYLALGTLQLPLGTVVNSNERKSVPQIVTIDNEGFFGLHSRIPNMPKSVVDGNNLKKVTFESNSKKLRMRRHSVESLASATSKSANSGDSDTNMDDSLSDISASGSSQIMPEPGSPISASPPASTNVHEISSVGNYDGQSIPRKSSMDIDVLNDSLKFYKEEQKASHNPKRHTYQAGNYDRSFDQYKEEYGTLKSLSSQLLPDYSADVRPLNVVKLPSQAGKTSKRSVSGGNVYYTCDPAANKKSSRDSYPMQTENNQVYSTADSREKYSRSYSQYNLPDTCYGSAGLTRHKKTSNRRKSDIPRSNVPDREYRFMTTSVDG